MPIYEYHCNGCGRRVQLFFRTFGAAESARCPHCQSTDLARLPSRVGYVRSQSSYEDFLSDPSNLDNVDYNDPKAVTQWARTMGEAAGLDMGPEYEQMIEQLEQGEVGSTSGLEDDESDFSDDLGL